MTQDDIIRMAREAGWTGIYSEWSSPTERTSIEVPVTIEQIERFAALVIQHKALDQLTAAGQYEQGFEDGAAAEREACAKILDAMAENDRLSNYYRVAALAIRARREQ